LADPPTLICKKRNGVDGPEIALEKLGDVKILEEHETLSKILRLETGIKNTLEKCDVKKNMLKI
jgi:hypothetical protein